MSIEKRRDGYCVRWRDSSGRPRSKQVRLWRDAVALDGDMKRKKALGELVVHEKGTIKLDDFWEVWCQNYASAHLSPRTLDAYGTLWRKHVLPALGPRTRVRAISREAVAAAVSQWSMTLRPSSVRKVCAVLSSVLQRAVEWGYIGTNPAASVRKPRIAGTQRRGQALTPEQINAICLELDDRSQVVVRVLAATGLRPGELRRLTWHDLGGAGISILKSKTHKTRLVEWDADAQLFLKAWWLASGKPGATALVFPDSHGKPWSDNAWKLWQRRVFAPAAGRAGLPDVVPYDLRHTRATSLIKAGRDVHYVASQMGHSPTVCLETYAHEFKSVYSECAANLPWAVNH